MEKRVRFGEYWKPLLIWVALLALAQLLGAVISLLLDKMIGNPDYSDASSLFGYVAMIALPILFCVIFKKRQLLPEMGFGGKRAVLFYLCGAFIGVITCVACITASARLNGVSFQQDSVVIPLLVVYAVAYCVQGMGEEVLYRGFLLHMLPNDKGMLVPVLISAACFSVSHAVNTDAGILSLINIFLIGVFLGLLMVTWNSIWLVGGFHALYNLAQTNIVDASGSTVSGAALYRFPSGYAFNVEGCWLTTVLFAILAAVIYVYARKKGCIA